MAEKKLAEGVEYTRPTTQLDLEERLAREAGDSPDDQTTARTFQLEGNDVENFVGVEPERMNYANDTEAPLAAEGGPEAEVEKRLADDPGGQTTLGPGASVDDYYTGRRAEQEQEQPKRATKAEAKPAAAGGTASKE